MSKVYKAPGGARSPSKPTVSSRRLDQYEYEQRSHGEWEGQNEYITIERETDLKPLQFIFSKRK